VKPRKALSFRDWNKNGFGESVVCHGFFQETSEDGGGPVALLEKENGDIVYISADRIRLLKED